MSSPRLLRAVLTWVIALAAALTLAAAPANASDGTSTAAAYSDCSPQYFTGFVCDPSGKVVGCSPVVVCTSGYPVYWVCPPGYSCNPSEIYSADVPGCPASYRCVLWWPQPPVTYPPYPAYPGYPGYPSYPSYPGYPEYPEYPGTECPPGQVGTYPTCQVVELPTKEEPTKEQEQTPPVVTPGDPAPAPQPGQPAAKPAVARKPTLAFKGKTKVTKRGAFSVACVATDAPAGATCRLRIIVGGKVLATVRAKVVSNAARLRLTLTKKQLRKVPKSRKVRVALDLVGPKGDVVLTSRASVKLPK